MTRPAQLVLAAVALVAVAGLVVAQRLKGEPAYVRRVSVTPRFTPNGDTLRDRATIRFAVGRRDVVAVTLLDAGGRPVRHLVRARPLPPGRRVRLRWRGRTDAGTPAPEGTYTVRVALRDRGRTIDLLERTRLRRVPPRSRAERRR